MKCLCFVLVLFSLMVNGQQSVDGDGDLGFFESGLEFRAFTVDFDPINITNGEDHCSSILDCNRKFCQVTNEEDEVGYLCLVIHDNVCTLAQKFSGAASLFNGVVGTGTTLGASILANVGLAVRIWYTSRKTALNK